MFTRQPFEEALTLARLTIVERRARSLTSVLLLVASVLLLDTANSSVAVAREARQGHAARPHVSEAMHHPDFNGDGFADLAVGSPFQTDGGADQDGTVTVFYGSVKGIKSKSPTVWSEASAGMPLSPVARDWFGWSVAAADFNHDGYDDVAVGVPYRTVSGHPEAGAVVVLFGSPKGLTTTNAQLWTQDSPGIKDVAQYQDVFGWALTAGDYNGDGYADLAIGDRKEDVTFESQGAVNVLYGSSNGLTANGNQFWNNSIPGMAEVAQKGQQFGRSLTSGDFDGDGYTDLAIGAPYDRLDHQTWGGSATVMYGSASGLGLARIQLWSEDSPGIKGTTTLRDEFGQSLAAGDFNHDGRDDLAIGVPFKDFTTIGDQGSINVIYGSDIGLASNGNQYWSLQRAGMPDTGHQGDQLGQVLTVGDLNGDGYADLVAGMPWKEFDGRVSENDGAVMIVYGSATRLGVAGIQMVSQATTGMLGGLQQWAAFGYQVGSADFDGDGDDDLAASVPYEDLALADQGAVAIVYGTSTGLTTTRNQLLTSPTPEISGEFGWSALSGGRPSSGNPRLGISPDCSCQKGGYPR